MVNKRASHVIKGWTPVPTPTGVEKGDGDVRVLISQLRPDRLVLLRLALVTADEQNADRCGSGDILR